MKIGEMITGKNLVTYIQNRQEYERRGEECISEEVKVTRRYAGETLRKRGGLNEGHTSDNCMGDPGDRTPQRGNNLQL